MKENNLNQFLENSFELARESIFLLNYSGDLIFVNTAGCKHLSYSFKEITKLKVWEIDANINTEEKFKDAIKLIEQSQKLEDNSVKSFHISSTKEIIPVSIMSKVITLDSEKYLISYVNNISDEIEQDEQIKLYFELIKKSNDFIFLVDFSSGQIEFANEKACESLGYSLDELKSMKASDFREPLDEEIELPEIFNKLKNDETLNTFGKYKTKSNNYIFVETSLSIKNYKGDDYILAMSRDISERIELERKREELNQQLENYNTRLKEEVSSIKKELIEYEDIMHRQSKLAAMGEMLENIAHQWRQPLSVISVLSTGMRLKNSYGDLSESDLDKALKDINISSQYLSKTIDDFRDFFKPNNKKSKFLIKDVIDYTSKLAKTKFSSSKLLLIENITNLEVYTFKNELIQVLINILNNAVDEIIKSKNKRKLIFIDVYEKDSFVVIKIKDNAGGIPLNIIERIYEPYFTTKEKSQGTGIGLYMSDVILRKHMSGTINAYNKEYSFENSNYIGAEFIIKFPKA
jgi:PAS domain S-box-containing protein